ncbi:hypothetical protein RYH80_14560 [Halobaculum sp. MBLA0147]|uniref:hypothetical protein n=1 Tax=Halobaculum sp. MBLA0147 TaxID=3079934 RepID=UPI0035236DB6
MYDNTPTEYGYEMTFTGFIEIDEMRTWATTVRDALDGHESDEWHCLVDMRDLDAMSPKAKDVMTEVKTECHREGLDRVATVVSDTTTRLQFQQMSRGTGAVAERYVAADQHETPLGVARAWVRDGVRPEGSA